jgi:hypothetical protein
MTISNYPKHYHLARLLALRGFSRWRPHAVSRFFLACLLLVGYAHSQDGPTCSSFTTKLGSNNVRGVYAVGSTVYIATYGGGLSISTDGGANFTNKTTTDGLGSNRLLGVYAVGTTVYAATDGGLSISTGNVYDAGLPKGLYKLSIRYWYQKGQGSIYPSTRQAAGKVLAYQEYWFRVQSKDGVGVGAARVAADNNLSSRRDLNPLIFASVMPNPVSSVLRLKVSEAKDPKVTINLMDASGRALLQHDFVPDTNPHQEEFNVSQLTNGMYFLKGNAGDKQATTQSGEGALILTVGS